MHAKASFVALCGMISAALGSVVVRPDDPYAFLAAEASSYEDLASRVGAFAAASGAPHEPVPSPVVTPAQQAELSEMFNTTRPVPGEFSWPLSTTWPDAVHDRQASAPVRGRQEHRTI